MTFARPFARSCFRLALCLAALCLAAPLAHADDPAPFNLTGPKVSVRVTRNGKTLPIGQVPNLQSGDKLWIHADLPADQSNHLLLVVAFLRGTTNEPPDNWFTKVETWDKKAREGTFVTVPEGAQQALLFLAPETGGDFNSLRSTVKQKPGQFIRADADLNEASFEQQRIERYLAAMKTVNPDDAKAIQDRSTKLAAALGLKVKDDCFKQPVNQQVGCLTQASAPVILGDTQGQNLAQALSNNGAGDLVNQASYTQAVGGGAYSAYVGAIVDVVRLVGNLRSSPDYQYIPGLTFPEGETLNLKLNTPPSFNKPKTVIVVGLPAVQKNIPPQLRAQTPNQVACLLQPNMALPVTGAPLLFSTGFASNLSLHLDRSSGATDIPLKPDAFQGGLVAQANDPKPVTTGDKIISGTVHGNWGFDTFQGPTLKLQQTDSGTFKVVGDTEAIAGQDKKLQLQGDAVGCVEHIALVGPGDHKQDVSFKAADGNDDKSKNTLDVTVPLKEAKPGDYSLLVKQFGKADPDKVPLVAYNGAIKLATVRIHAGDTQAVLTGDGVANVASVVIDKVEFTPTGNGDDPSTLHLAAKSGVSPKDGEEATAKLKDGRTLPVKVDAQAARPTLKLLSMKSEAASQQGALPITLTGKDEIPLQGKLTFVLQTEKPFDRSQKVEVATASGGAHTDLSLGGNSGGSSGHDSSLMLQDEHTAIATLNPQEAFGDSAFGKLQMRPIAADGTPGDWSPLGTLVRVPQITGIQCSPIAHTNGMPVPQQYASDAPAPTGTSTLYRCTVQGSRLFLVQSFSGTQDFQQPAEVPTGFSDPSFTVPRPADGSTLYLKLRDDPGSVAAVKLPTPLPQPASAPAPNSGSAASSVPQVPQAPQGPAAPAAPQAPTAPQAPAASQAPSAEGATPAAPSGPKPSEGAAAAPPASSSSAPPSESSQSTPHP
ncbi:hypothetical protein [Terriglobus aquaticus]|uniref:DUF5666 domain-containing protein n=1 Tax=Terriglobus aquaticus TaxID=940139 RepID=A0ABW9KFM8_9BACT|nr:hypothetical protein [Terriglobus aquaticus]